MTVDYLIIPAAGLGTRMKAAARGKPKEMLDVGGRPAIQRAVYQGLLSGVTHAVIVIRRGKEIIRDYFEDADVARALFPEASAELARIRRQMTLHFRFQERPRGECDAIYTARDILENSPFAVMYPDNIPLPEDGGLPALVNAFSEKPSDVTALMEPGPDMLSGVSNSGRVDISPVDSGLRRIRKFLPKGPGSFRQRFPGELRTCGMYVTLPHYLDYIGKMRRDLFYESKHAAGELTDGAVRRKMLADGIFFYGKRLDCRVFDIGNPEGYTLCLKRLEQDLEKNFQAESVKTG